jgi:hypothetical protein
MPKESEVTMRRSMAELSDDELTAIIRDTEANQAFPLTTDLIHYEEWVEDDLKARHEKLVRLAWEMLGLAPALAWPAAAE